jgi:VanZ family protein
MVRLIHARTWYVLGVLLTLAVIFVCLMPARDLPSVSVNDKVEHITAYVALAIWFGGLFTRRAYLWLALGLLVLGGGIEIAQGLMGLGRTADVKDFLADGLGVLIGLGACLAGFEHWVSWIERWTRRT